MIAKEGGKGGGVIDMTIAQKVFNRSFYPFQPLQTCCKVENDQILRQITQKLKQIIQTSTDILSRDLVGMR